MNRIPEVKVSPTAEFRSSVEPDTQPVHRPDPDSFASPEPVPPLLRERQNSRYATRATESKPYQFEVVSSQTPKASALEGWTSERLQQTAEKVAPGVRAMGLRLDTAKVGTAVVSGEEMAIAMAEDFKLRMNLDLPPELYASQKTTIAGAYLPSQSRLVLNRDVDPEMVLADLRPYMEWISIDEAIESFLFHEFTHAGQDQTYPGLFEEVSSVTRSFMLSGGSKNEFSRVNARMALIEGHAHYGQLKWLLPQGNLAASPYDPDELQMLRDNLDLPLEELISEAKTLQYQMGGEGIQRMMEQYPSLVHSLFERPVLAEILFGLPGTNVVLEVDTEERAAALRAVVDSFRQVSQQLPPGLDPETQAKREILRPPLDVTVTIKVPGGEPSQN